MIKLIGLKKINTAIFISGTGTNLKNLIKFSLSKDSPIIIKNIISNKTKAKGLNYANKYRIKKKIFKFNSNQENKILNFLKKNQIELICLAGFMKILSKNLLKNLKEK